MPANPGPSFLLTERATLNLSRMHEMYEALRNGDGFASMSKFGITIRQPAGSRRVRGSRQSDRGMFPVYVEKDGGSNGNASAAASYTYTVRDFDSFEVLASNVAQVHPRAYGAVDYQAGTNGVGVAYQSGTSVALYLAGEVPQVSTCE
jgi:hypothetical protein